MKKLPIFFIMLLFALSATAQKKELLIRKGLAGLYLEHKVSPKESFFAIGRMYNVSPKSIADYNKLELSKGLSVDQKLRIPLSDTNFTQEGNKGAPLYYKTDDKDHLPSLSVKYNNIPIEKLKNWNNIDSDDVKPGTKLLVGFLKGSEFPSVTIKTKAKPDNKTSDKPVEEKTVDKPVVKTEDPPVVKTEDPPVIKTEEKPEIKTENKPENKPETKTETPVEEKPAPSEQGYFKTNFDQQIRIIPATKTETVTAGIFKTSSGWSDAKYYLLIDKVPPGTIIRVINPTNNKVVYAKVLGEMTGIRQNEGLNIRISNAAASALEITEQDKFIVNVNY